jgi:hypothetical protein
MSLISHIERTLGQLDKGWSLDGCSGSFQVARFRNRPFDGVSTYATLGLSRHTLPMSKEREVRQEFVFSTYEKFSPDKIASFMLSFGEYVLERHQALLRGDVVGPVEPIIPSVAANAVYASVPVIFDQSFSTYEGTLPSTIMVWLVPLVGNEANFIKSNGWGRFEDILEREDPDLWDLNRLPAVE